MTGRRERKKAATRQALADAALELALDRGGYDAVTVAEIAERADVSVTTLFAHFPSKEALFFDQDADQEAGLVAAVRDRGEVPLLDALEAYAARHSEAVREMVRDPEHVRFRRLIVDSPTLRAYADRMWLRHEHALARAVADDLGEAEPSPATRVLAHVFCGMQGLVQGPDDDAGALRRATFAVLRTGWSPGP